MFHSALHDLCQQPVLVASTEKYQQLVYDSTTELVQPIQCILSALDRRAMRLSKCATFESALNDGNLMQQLLSSSALEYMPWHCIWWIPRIPTIPIFNKVDAEQRQNIRIDVITQLSVEIVFTKLIPMFMKENTMDAVKRCECLATTLFDSSSSRDASAKVDLFPIVFTGNDIGPVYVELTYWLFPAF
ncbi:hypothetical protein LRAMOSA08967 [Lichtheimia ramosa]|uniref:Uncharacterized protein n=1 Tax=Lichtheimia ramosa TaxID=688394 RepID=A0A077WGZ4_9FUNG|nr:hypothetical protein LRAMOSA08967 [Lichtheimia ramosa]